MRDGGGFGAPAQVAAGGNRGVAAGVAVLA